jgi:hypothetical protein
MIGAILEFDDLRKLSGLGERAQLATVERWATRAGIKYSYDGKGGIWTTMDAMNAALGLSKSSGQAANEPYSADQVL